MDDLKGWSLGFCFLVEVEFLSSEVLLALS
jgi:hypothetical protein